MRTEPEVVLNFWSDDIKTVLPEFADAYNRIRIRETAYPSRDTLVDARPDFVYAAYKSAFSDDPPGMREVLEAASADFTCVGRAGRSGWFGV